MTIRNFLSGLLVAKLPLSCAFYLVLKWAPLHAEASDGRVARAERYEPEMLALSHDLETATQRY